MFRRLWRRIGRWARVAWIWGRVAWVCRVSVLSALGGGYLLYATAQARDLFSDLGLSVLQWFIFFVLVFLWAHIVHIVARRTLQSDYWVPDAHVPGGLQQQRREELQSRYLTAAVWVPRLLGGAVFFLVSLSIYDAWHNLARAKAGLAEAADASILGETLGVVAFITAVLYVVTAWTPNSSSIGLSRRIVTGWNGTSAPLLAGVEPFPNLSALSAILGRNAAPTGARVARGGLVAVSTLITVLFFVVFFHPHVIAENLPRAIFAPVLLGSLVIALGELTLWSYLARMPFILTLIVIAATLKACSGPFHDVRWVAETIRHSSTGTLPYQIGMEEAVRRWRWANGCGEEFAGAKCPRQIGRAHV